MSKERGDIERWTNTSVQEKLVYPETEMLKKRLAWFQDLKLGVIFHYGLYAEAGIVESWQLSEKDDWAREHRPFREDIDTLKLDYWNTVSRFNPIELNTDAWAELCQKAGIKYAIFTTKHHDGFNMYNTMTSAFKVTGKLSPCKVDIFEKVCHSFRSQGLAMGAYFSKADWFCPYYWLDDETVKGRLASYDPEERPEIWQKYVEFVHEQIREITHNYGDLDILWLDAGWCGDGKEDLQMDKLAEIARAKQPEMIIVDRSMGGRHENYETPERMVPDFHEIPSKAWESNIPIGNEWGYVPNDDFKSSQELIEAFVDVISKGGNLVLGVGPTPDGKITPEETQRLLEIGKWTQRYQEGIYYTRGKASPNESKWKFTYAKDSDLVKYAFCANHILSEKLQQRIYLKEIAVSEKAVLIDLATNQPLEKRMDTSGTYIQVVDLCIPTIGCLGIKCVEESDEAEDNGRFVDRRKNK